MTLIKARTALALGGLNLMRVFLYQLGIKTGLNKVKKITSQIEPGDFFNAHAGSIVSYPCNLQWTNKHTYFGNSKPTPSIPNWYLSCLNAQLAPSDTPWYLIGDFNDQLGDIKGV